MELKKVLLWVKVELGVIAMKVYTTDQRSPELEPDNLIKFSIIAMRPLY